MVKAFVKALIAKSDDSRTKVIDIDSSFWAKSMFQRIFQAYIYYKKLEISNNPRKEAALPFHYEIMNCVVKYNILESLVLNLDQTPSKYATFSNHTIAAASSKYIPAVGSTYKQAFRATFGVTLNTGFLPMELIYGGGGSQV